ncbi:glutaredoxin family protein [Candidatus Woesearchaeota archaeon]|nr:glutaredoxin family protein [Candidatus Woesearchaeota archaeon]
MHKTKSSSSKKLADKSPAEKTSKYPLVKVYSTPTCPYCHMAKEYLKSNNVPFEDINVAANEKAADEMQKKTGQLGVPVIEIGNTIIVGFDKAAINEALKLKPKAAS